MSKLVKRLLLLALFGALLIIAPALIGQQGYVLIALGNTTIEGSVVSFIITMLVGGFAIYLLFLLIKFVFVALVMPSKWWQKRHANAHANFFQSGLDLMALGQWQQAAEQMLKVKRTSRIEAAKQLSLVCAVHAQQESLTEQVQTKLALPAITDESSKQDVKQLEVKFAQLVLLTQQGEFQQADTLITKLQLPLLKQTSAYQQLWLEVKLALAQWSDLDKFLVKIAKQQQKQLSDDAYQNWLSNLEGLMQNSFYQFVQSTSINQLQQVYQGLSKGTQNLAGVNQAYLNVLSSTKQPELIESTLIEQSDKKGATWLLTNIRAYFEHAGTVHMDKLFAKVQKRVTKEQDNKELLTVFAYLAAGQKDHQLAKQALEQVIYTNHNRLDNKLYALTLAELGEVRRSIEVFKAL